MLQCILTASRIKSVAVCEERKSSLLFTEIGYCFCIIWAQESQIAKFSEMHFNSYEFSIHINVFDSGCNAEFLQFIKLAGATLNISEKAVNIPFAGDTAGVVTSSTGENKVAVAEDGSMEVNSLNMNKLVQSDGDTLILDGGNAAV